MGAILTVDNINVYYGSIHAIKGISFEVNAGEIVTLIGANGAGKSTTLNTISGLLRSRTGSIQFMGEDLGKLPPHKTLSKGLALVPEGRRIFLQMTVQENLDMGAYIRKNNIKPELDMVYDYFPRLKERSKQVAGTLSGGEQQMLAMGRALMSKPKVIMLDEPSMGLAPSWWRRSLRSSSTSTRPAPPSCWWNRMPRPPCPWPIGATSWRRARSSPPAPAQSCWTPQPSRRLIWAVKAQGGIFPVQPTKNAVARFCGALQRSFLCSSVPIPVGRPRAWGTRVPADAENEAGRHKKSSV